MAKSGLAPGIACLNKMDDQKNPKMAVVAITFLLVGGIVGYYIGFNRAGGAEAASAKQKSEEAAQAAEKVAAEAANPFSKTGSNPLKGVQTNPYGNVKVNPFAQ